MRPFVPCLSCFYFISIVFAGLESELKKEKIESLDWVKIEWEKKAPLEFGHQPRSQSEERSPTSDTISSPRRASAPLRRRSIRTVQKHDLQARRHNSAPILRLRLTARPMMTPQQVVPSLETPKISPTHMTSSQEFFIASPIDYFDPRFASAATPDELKNCGITKESVSDTMNQRHNDHLRDNLQQGLLTCSLCMNTFTNIESLQIHLRDHLS